ncbi:MAG: peptidase C45 acyl-coenzyme A:6-aminopenicillanic acid acyl-transferase [Candidatus Riflebacteria bacterium]|nr:peptidase C45 acyl-coenzyme A:6-aminopenicillanic acid acyl-transferase [Candidatus Riflebacteria bacterium]
MSRSQNFRGSKKTAEFNLTDHFFRGILAVFLILAFFLCPTTGNAQNLTSSKSVSTKPITRRLKELARPLLEDVPVFRFDVKVSFWPPIEKHHAHLAIFRNGEQDWGIRLTSSWRNFAIQRTATMSAIVLPDARVRFIGRDALLEPEDLLNPKGFVARFLPSGTAISGFLALMGTRYFNSALRFIIIPKLKCLPARPRNPGELLYQFDDKLMISFFPTGKPGLCLEVPKGPREVDLFKSFELSFEPGVGEVLPASWSDPQILDTEVSRVDLEKTVFRGLKRILSIKTPGALPTLKAQRVDHGELLHHQGQTLVVLSGTPEQIGTAHGLLLQPWNKELVDSTVYLIGLYQTISKGKWFLSDLEDAWKRLSPNIPVDLHREMEALASACPDISLREVRLSNIFPEYFHCSGFAMFGRATTNGVLYHGRILDYMTEIGLQNNAVAFVIKPLNKRAFFCPGFAGIVGSVGGMNEKQISIGEMGGRGRYQWDGIPMSILVRRALEECDTLEQVKALWSKGPRTCEYFYVFADGKIPDAVAVWATSTSIEFLGSGESHFFLGEGIPDTVVLSAGERLKLLRTRVQDGYGTFTATSAMRLMDRPVSMQSNLHDVLFIPQLQEIYIAVATPFEPAAEQAYVRYDFKKILSRGLP